MEVPEVFEALPLEFLEALSFMAFGSALGVLVGFRVALLELEFSGRRAIGVLLPLVGLEDVEVELDPVALEVGVGEHGVEVGPLGVQQGVLDVVLERDLVEAVEEAGDLFVHNGYLMAIIFYLNLGDYIQHK